MRNRPRRKEYFGIYKKLSLGVIVVFLILSTGAASWPAPDEDMLNPTEPEYYDITGAHQFTDSDEESMAPNILIDGDDNLHVIWADQRNDPADTDLDYQFDLYYMKFDAAGDVVIDETRLWDMSTIPTYLEPNTGVPRYYMPHASVALDSDDDIHVAYQDYTQNTYSLGTRINSEIYYMKLDGGALDADDLVLVEGQRVSTGQAHSGSVDIGVDSEDNVHIVWYDHRSTYYNWEIYYEKLDNDGTVLIQDKRLTTQLWYQAAPELAIDSKDNLHVAYKQYDQFDDVHYINYLKIDKNGNSLVSPKTITTDGLVSPSPYGKGYPLIVADSNDNIHMAWHDDRADSNKEIYYLKLDDDGDALMTQPLRVTDNTGVSSIQGIGPVQSMGIDDSDNIYLLWRDDTPGSEQIYIAVLNPDGSIFYEPYQITDTDSFSESPSITFDSWNNIHIAWSDNVTGASEIYHAILSPPTFKLAFEAKGVKGSIVEVLVIVNDKVVEQLDVESHGDIMVTDTVFQFRDDDEYELEFWLKDGSGNKNNQGAAPVKVYLVRDGEDNEELEEVTVNQNKGKNEKKSQTVDVTDKISEYFE